jgi:hypothetical protein
MRIINLTQHASTEIQRAQGLPDLSDQGREILTRMITFDDPPTAAELADRAAQVAKLDVEADPLQVGLPP